MVRRKANEIDAAAGRLIQLVRKKKGLTGKELGKMIDVSFEQISFYENGKARMALSTFIDICTSLEQDPVDMLKALLREII